MANNHTNVRATDGQGQHLSIHHTSTDSPILPAGNLLELKQIDPKLVDWVIAQTEIEADHRRKSERKINSYVFIERISGVIAGALVAIIGFAIGGYVILQGHDWAGTILCGTTLVAIVSVLVTKHRMAELHQESAPKRKTKTTRPIASKR